MQKYEDDRQFHEIGIISGHGRKIQRGDYMVERLKIIMDGRYGDSFTQEKSTTQSFSGSWKNNKNRKHKGTLT